MNISCRIANADTQCGRITNPPKRARFEIYKSEHFKMAKYTEYELK